MIESKATTLPQYSHTQRAPLCLLVYVLAVTFFVLSWTLRDEPPFRWLFPPIGLLMLVLAGSFQHLRVQDQVESLSICFGPIPLFRRTILYSDIQQVEVGRTLILDGWGIHMSIRGGWVWNLWGRDCVVVNLKNGVLRIGTDDPDRLAEFLTSKISTRAK